MKTIRLIFPQWQGARLQDGSIPEVPNAKDARLGYSLGAKLLELLVPENKNQKTIQVPVSTALEQRPITFGVSDRDVIVKQAKEALSILEKEDPERIITLGGECSVSVTPFTYLAKKYQGDVAVLWISAFPNLSLPGDSDAGFHSMAVTALMGKGDENIMSVLPYQIPANRILYVGLRDWEREQIRNRQKEFGIKNLSNEDILQNSDKVLEWIRSTGAKRILVHFNLCILDPTEIIASACNVKQGLKMQVISRIINDVSEENNVIGLTIAESFPRTALRLQKMFSGIRIFKDA